MISVHNTKIINCRRIGLFFQFQKNLFMCRRTEFEPNSESSFDELYPVQLFLLLYNYYFDRLKSVILEYCVPEVIEQFKFNVE